MFRRNKAAFLLVIFSVTILIYPAADAPTPPVALFTYTPAAPIFRQVIVFDASASYDPDGGTIVSYRWDFDDGTAPVTLDEPIANHNYTTFGTYNITLTVTDDEAETDTTWQMVTVIEYPVAVFTHSPVSPIVGETVTFNASLSTPEGGNITSYEWDFDDGNVTTVTSPIINHVYTTPADYTVILNVTDSEGLWDTESKLITVRGIPVAEFVYSPERPIRNEPVTFNASLSTSDGGTIVSYFWDFGDGTNGTGMIVNHTYTTIGNYTASLTITDSENLTDTAQATFTVRDYPVASFDYEPKLPLVNETVDFDASASTADGGNITSYEWDFGDGSLPVTEADPETTHVYTAFGTYNVSLTITDSEDLTDTFLDTIRILIAPVANFTYSPIKPVVNEMVTFDASASYDLDGTIDSYFWDFGDGNTELYVRDVNLTATATHAYTAAGTYTVNLTVTDDDGLTDTVSKLIPVYTFLYVHDVAITSVTPSATEVYVGRIVNITVVAKNEGTTEPVGYDGPVESFNVTVYYNAISIGTQPVIDLLPGSDITLTFTWNTTGVIPCRNYTINATATQVSGETETTDNTLVDGTIKLRLIGDVNGNGVVLSDDIIVVQRPENYAQSTPANPYADVNCNGVVLSDDIIVIQRPENYAQTCP